MNDTSASAAPATWTGDLDPAAGNLDRLPEYAHLAAIRDRDESLFGSRSAPGVAQQDRHALLRLLDAAIRDRDLAIAHDRQPYPTAWAYEQACKALNAAKAMNGVHERTIARLRGQAADNVDRDVAVQRERHLVQWGEPGAHHRDGTGPNVVWAFTGRSSYVAQCAVEETRRAFAEEVGTWRDILTEEVAEAYAERDPAALRARLIRVAAVAQDWAADIDGREQSPTQGVLPVETAGSAK